VKIKTRYTYWEQAGSRRKDNETILNRKPEGASGEKCEQWIRYCEG
jgi:hypothetical protein